MGDIRLNDRLDIIVRDIGCYHNTIQHDQQSGEVMRTGVSFVGKNDMEDALIEALDAGLTAEEIADIQLGSIS